jgi:hypothetical protein
VHEDIRHRCKIEGRYHMENSGTDGRIISKWISSKVDQEWMGTEFI